MIKVKNYFENENVNVEYSSPEVGLKIVSFDRDLSVNPVTAQFSYFMSKMNCKKRQAFIHFDGSRTWTTSPGSMLWMGSNVQAKTVLRG